MISIITPVYNGKKFIEECVKVVFNQNCLDLEHIIVDGGSNDGSIEIIDRLAQDYNQIRWISEPDKGQSDAMNKGINMAKGEVIGILNVDDFYEPNVLIRISKIFKSLPEPSLLIGNCNILDSNNKIKKLNKPSRLKLADLIMRRHPFPFNPSAYFYHKSLHEKIGPYNDDEHYMMDLEFIIKAVQSANVRYVDETWGNHRQIPGAKTVELKKNDEHSRYLLDFLAKQRKQLPLRYKLQLFPILVMQKIQFFSKNPQKLYPSIINKITKNFKLYAL